MSALSNCQECGKKLRDCIFCRRCDCAVCSCRCLDLHNAKHIKTPSMPPLKALAPVNMVPVSVIR